MALAREALWRMVVLCMVGLRLEVTVAVCVHGRGGAGKSLLKHLQVMLELVGDAAVSFRCGDLLMNVAPVRVEPRQMNRVSDLWLGKHTTVKDVRGVVHDVAKGIAVLLHASLLYLLQCRLDLLLES